MDEFEIGQVYPSRSDGRPYRYKGGDPADKKNWEPVEEEEQGALADAGGQLLRGLSEAGHSTAGGLARLVGAKETARSIDRSRELARDYYGAANTRTGKVAGFTGRLLGEGALAAAPGLALRGGAAALGAAAKVGPKLATLLNVGVDVASEAGERAQDSTLGYLADVTGSERLKAASENPYARGAAGAGVGQLVGLGLHAAGGGAVAGAKKLRDAAKLRRGSVEAAEQAANQADDVAKVLDEAEVPSGEPPVRPGQAKTRTPISKVKPEIEKDFENVLEHATGNRASLARAKEDISLLKHSEELVNRPRTEQEVLEAAKGVDIDRLLERETGTMLSGEESQALRQAYDAQAAERTALEKQLAGMGNGDPARPEIEARLEKAENRSADILTQHATGGSETGRALRFRRIENEYLASKTLDPMTWKARAERALKGQLPPHVDSEIDRLIAKGDRKGLAEFISGLGEPLDAFKDPTGYAAELVKPGLLSAATSVTRPLIGNATNLAFRVMNAPSTAMWNQVVGKVAGTAPLARVGAKRAVELGVEGAKKEVGDVVREGLPASVRGAYEMSSSRDLKPIFGVRKIAKRVANLVKAGKYSDADIEATGVTPIANMFRKAAYMVQGALDSPYRGAARGIAAEEVATNWSRVAPDRLRKYLRAQGMPPSEVEGIVKMAPAERMAHLKANPTPQMELEIEDIANEATYQNESLFHEAARDTKRWIKGKNKVAGDIAEMAMPLTKTGGGIIQASVESTPVGTLLGAANVLKLKKLVKAADPEAAAEIFATQRKAVRQLGRSAGITTGLGIYLGHKWMKEGRMTGDIPEDATARAEFFNENKQPYAIKVGDRWVPPALLQPWATPIVVGAMLAEGKGVVGSGVEAAKSQVVEAPFYRGAAAAVTSLAKGKARGQTLGETIAQTSVPSIVNAARRFEDPVQRRRSGPLEEFKSRVPGLAGQLEPQIAPTTGEEQQSEYTLPQRIGEFFDPTSSSPSRSTRDPVLRELERVGAAVGNPNQDKKKRGETDKAYTARLKEGGQLVKQVMGAFIDPNGDTSILDENGVDPDLIDEYWTLRGGPQTPKALADQADILEDVISRLRTRATTARRKAEKEAAGL